MCWCLGKAKSWVIFLNLGEGHRVLLLPRLTLRTVFSFRGQVLPADSLVNTVDVELIYGGIKYILTVKAYVSWMSPALWRLEGVFIFVMSHRWSGFCHAWVPGCPM